MERFNALDPKRMLGQEGFAFRAREDPGRRADGSDATRPQRAGDADTVFRPHIVQKSEDEAGVEGVAAAGTVHVVGRKHVGLQPNAVADQHTALPATSNHYRTRAHSPKHIGLAERIGFPRDHSAFMAIGQKNVYLR